MEVMWERMAMKKVTICRISMILLLLIPMMLASCPSNKVQELVKENSELRTKNEALEKENAELRTQIEELKGKLGELKSKEDDQSRQAAREAIRALQKLEARFQAGISYRDYAPALGETIYQVNLYLESPEAKKKPQLAESIGKVLFHYAMIKEVWDEKYAGRETHDGIREWRTDLRKKVLSFYPKADVDNISYIIWNVILKEASEELKKAASLLSQ